ncbi:hypothetical protein [Mesorhizobium sp. M0496]
MVEAAYRGPVEITKRGSANLCS